MVITTMVGNCEIGLYLFKYTNIGLYFWFISTTGLFILSINDNDSKLVIIDKVLYY